jgi:predicted transcriptional regulator
MSKNEVPKLSAGNFEIMKVIWEKGESTAAEVLEEINRKRDKKVGRTSVLVQLTRLREYGWLKYRKVKRTFYYSAAFDREKATRDIVNDIKTRIFNGSSTELVRYLFQDSEISHKELKEIREMLDRFEGSES